MAQKGFDIATGNCIKEIPTDPGVLSFSLASDDTTIVFGCEGKVVKAYDIASGKHIYSIPIKDADALMAFSRDGKKLVLSGEGRVTLWDTATGFQIK